MLHLCDLGDDLNLNPFPVTYSMGKLFVTIFESGYGLLSRHGADRHGVQVLQIGEPPAFKPMKYCDAACRKCTHMLYDMIHDIAKLLRLLKRTHNVV